MKKDIKKQELRDKMIAAIADYKEHNEFHSTADGRYEKAQTATKAFAEYCNISYKQACSIAMELFI